MTDGSNQLRQKNENDPTLKNGNDESANVVKSSDDLKLAIGVFLKEFDSKRKHDDFIFNCFKKEWTEQNEKCFELMDDAFSIQHERTNNKLQEKLAQFTQILDRISILEAELEEFNRAINNLFQDLRKN